MPVARGPDLVFSVIPFAAHDPAGEPYVQDTDMYIRRQVYLVYSVYSVYHASLALSIVR